MRNLAKLQTLALSTVLSCTLAAISCVLASTIVLAQAGLGSLSGTVTDASKAVVPNAPVTLTNQATGYSQATTTNGTGGFRFLAVPVTSGYVVHVSAAGFKDAEMKGIETSVGVRIVIG